ncbi:hypothetical protein ACHAW6_014456 [Cyclotella cf. meneghiniana]
MLVDGGWPKKEIAKATRTRFIIILISSRKPKRMVKVVRLRRRHGRRFAASGNFSRTSNPAPDWNALTTMMTRTIAALEGIQSQMYEMRNDVLRPDASEIKMLKCHLDRVEKSSQAGVVNEDIVVSPQSPRRCSSSRSPTSQVSTIHGYHSDDLDSNSQSHNLVQNDLELGIGLSGAQTQPDNAATIANILMQSALSPSPTTTIDDDGTSPSRSHSNAPSSVVSWPALSSNQPHAARNQESTHQQHNQRPHSLTDAIIIAPSDLTHTATCHSYNTLHQHTTLWTRCPTDPTKLPFYLWPVFFLPFAAMLVIIMLIVLIGVAIRSYF